MDASGACTSDDACSDGTFCNGVERCDPEAGDADARGCVAGSPPCAAAACDEGGRRCDATCDGPEDADADGEPSPECGGTDCDDADPSRFPGNAEVCDVADRDEDCDPRTFGVRDADGDGFADMLCCNVDAADGARRCGTDCDDAASGVHPGLAESCDGIDNDCDGAVDELVVRTFYVDADGDGDGDSDAPTTTGCTLPAGYSESGGDCDDGDSNVGPGATELCDGIDQNCSTGGGPDPTEDADDDGFTVPGHECTGGFPETDCDDTSATINPAAPELCASPADDDCDGTIDESTATDAVDWYPDTDGDGYGAGTATRGCTGPTRTHVDRAGDCHATNADVRPGAPYQTAPFCRGACSTACGSGSSYFCARSDCFTVCVDGPAPEWDYNCSGAVETQYLPPGHPLGRCSSSAAGCTGPSVWAEDPVCGATQTLDECAYNSIGFCTHVASREELVRCR